MMSRRIVLAFLLPLLTACARNDAEPSKQPERPELRDRIMKMVEVDQAARTEYAALFSNGKQPAAAASARGLAQLDSVDRANTAELKQLIEHHGWPTRKRVGRDGAGAAFLLAQHADRDPAFQKRYLAFARSEFRKGDLPGEAVALLEDRTRVAEGKKQLYGTQMQLIDGELKIQPIEDETNVDRRRREMGLPTMAEYMAEVRKQYGLER